MSVVLVTGGSGFLGSCLIKVLLERSDTVYVLARGTQHKNAAQRVAEMLQFWGSDITQAKDRLRFVEGDITRPALGIASPEVRDAITHGVEVIYHCAALAQLRVPLGPLREINVEGTRNVLDFAVRCAEKGRLRNVNHISTAYVAGICRRASFGETTETQPQAFHNTYEQTKYEAERVVAAYRKTGLQVSVFRPSLIMGDSRTGKTNDFRLFYEPLHFFSREIYGAFPADVRSHQNLIHIDTAAEAICLLGERDGSGTYHITSPAPTNIGAFLATASDFFGFRLPVLVPVEEFRFDQWTPVQRMLAGPFVPYFNYRTQFTSERTQGLLARAGFRFPDIDTESLRRVFAYVSERGYIRKREGHGYPVVDKESQHRARLSR